MAIRLWFLVQLAPRFAAYIPLRNSVNVPLLARCIRSSKLLCSEQKLRKSRLSAKSNPAAVSTLDEKFSVKGSYSRSNYKGNRNLAKSNFSAKGEDSPSKLIWEGHKIRTRCGLPPKKTRKQCKRNSKKAISGSPCAICANDVEVTYEDVTLLQQFICPFTGKVLDPVKTGVCRLQQKKLVAAITKARDSGLLQFTVPRPDVRLS